MKIQISLSIAAPPPKLPDLKILLSPSTHDLLVAWHGGYLRGKKVKPSMFTVDAFRKAREEFKDWLLWNPPQGDIYRGMSLSTEDFLKLMHGGKLEPRAEVVSWTTNRGTAAEYSRGMAAKLLTFSVIFVQPVSNTEILMDLRGDVQRQVDGGAYRNYEVVIPDAPLTRSMIANVYITAQQPPRIKKQAFAALNSLYEEGLLVDKPDEGFMTYILDKTKTRLQEGA